MTHPDTHSVLYREMAKEKQKLTRPKEVGLAHPIGYLLMAELKGVPYVIAVAEYCAFVNARRQNICCSNFGSSVQMFVTRLPCLCGYEIFWRRYHIVIMLVMRHKNLLSDGWWAQHWMRCPSLLGRLYSRRRGHSCSMPAFTTERVVCY